MRRSPESSEQQHMPVITKTDVVYRLLMTEIRKAGETHFFIDGQSHLWAYRNDPDSCIDENNSHMDFMRQQGDLVEEISHGHSEFYGGVEVEMQHTVDANGKTKPDHRAMHEETIRLLKEGALVVYQASGYVEYPEDEGAAFMMADILVYNEETGCYDMYEVKSSLEVSGRQKLDASFQSTILREALEKHGFKLGKCFIVHPRRSFLCEGDINPEEYLEIEEVTEEVAEHKKIIRGYLRKALETINAPSAEGMKRCTKPKDCPTPHICHANLPERYSIYEIPAISNTNKTACLKAGITSIFQIDEDTPIRLSKRQKEYVEMVKSGVPRIKTDALRERLEKLEYPVFYFDFETANPAVPLQGFHPSEHVPFQLSVHVQKEEEGEVIHLGEVLCTDTKELGPAFMQSMKELMAEAGEESDGGCSGTICVQGSFENSRIQHMRAKYATFLVKEPELARFMNGLQGRIFDIEHVISDGLYIDPEFKGRRSIKIVLEALFPEFSYSELEGVKEGSGAIAQWYRLMTEDLSEDEKKEIYDSLWEYCKRDTFALAKLHQFYSTVSGPLELTDHEKDLLESLESKDLVSLARKIYAMFMTSDSNEAVKLKKDLLQKQIEQLPVERYSANDIATITQFLEEISKHIFWRGETMRLLKKPTKAGFVSVSVD